MTTTDHTDESCESAFDRMRGSAMARALGLIGLILLLQVPIEMISSTINERSARRNEAITDVTRTWGHRQEVRGPFLVVPYVMRIEEPGRPVREEWSARYLLPSTLTVDGALDATVRRRGIFDVPLYVGTLSVQGSFQLPEASAFPAEATVVQWDHALLAVAISDPKSIRENVTLDWDGHTIGLEPGLVGFNMYETGLSARLPLDASVAGTTVPFSMALSLAGSDGLSVLPVGDDTTVRLRSGWADPSFDGAYPPVERTVTPAGFTATWRVLRLARSFPSSWRRGELCRKDLDGSLLGVSLLSPVDAYRTTDRAVKYQLLFVGLTFVTFFLFELLGGLRVHPIQYLLVGLALCLFYLLLLSLAEHVGFDLAYGAASLAIAALVTSYSRAVLRDRRGVGVIAGLTSGLYAYLYVLLQIQDYALLVGSIGLFAILAAVMWLTRRVDWYALRLDTRPASSVA